MRILNLMFRAKCKFLCPSFRHHFSNYSFNIIIFSLHTRLLYLNVNRPLFWTLFALPKFTVFLSHFADKAEGHTGNIISQLLKSIKNVPILTFFIVFFDKLRIFP